MPFWNALQRGLGADSWTRTPPHLPHLSRLDLSALASGIFRKSPLRSAQMVVSHCSLSAPIPGAGDPWPSSSLWAFWLGPQSLAWERRAEVWPGEGPGGQRRVAGGQPRPYLCEPLRPRTSA